MFPVLPVSQKHQAFRVLPVWEVLVLPAVHDWESGVMHVYNNQETGQISGYLLGPPFTLDAWRTTFRSHDDCLGILEILGLTVSILHEEHWQSRRLLGNFGHFRFDSKHTIHTKNFGSRRQVKYLVRIPINVFPIKCPHKMCSSLYFIFPVLGTVYDKKVDFVFFYLSTPEICVRTIHLCIRVTFCNLF